VMKLPPEVVEQRKALARRLMEGGMDADEMRAGFFLWLRLQLLEGDLSRRVTDETDEEREAKAAQLVKRMCPTGRMDLTDWVAMDAGIPRPAMSGYDGEESGADEDALAAGNSG
jgi:hypothetical protein